MANTNTPRSQEEFEALMEEVDEALRAKRVAIPAREIRALQELSVRLKIRAVIAPLPDREPVGYEGEDLLIRAARWIRDRYGSRLALDVRPGRAVLLLRGDPWEIRIPRFYGSHRLFADPHTPSDAVDDVTVGGADTLPGFNVLDAITGLTAAMRQSLTKSECAEVSLVFRAVIENLHLLEAAARRHSLIREALVDLDSSTHLVMGPTPSYGQAKWASLQLAEKGLKAFILAAGERAPRSHDLRKIEAVASDLGAGRIPGPWMDRVQCPAGVRYGELSVELQEAVGAQHAALDIAAEVVSDFSFYGY